MTTQPPTGRGVIVDEEAGLDSDMPAGPSTPASGLLTRGPFVLGSAGLVVAAAADAFAVAGRHLGFRFIGSIELVQAAVVCLACAAMLVATLEHGHASVHVFTDRLGQIAKARLARIAGLLSAAAFLAIAVGSVWVLAELWRGYEQTELLHLPLRWLRLLWIVFALLIAGAFAFAALRRLK